MERNTVLIRDIHECEEITAGDATLLRELLHPHKADIKIHYSLAHAIVTQGQTTTPHRLKTSEVYYILEGQGVMHIDDERSPVTQGQAVYIPPGAAQSITNTGTCDLKFLCIVDPAWRKEDEVILA
jgi:mannose-6-phosphate isomerase-like protein (cupin superfamily)